MYHSKKMWFDTRLIRLGAKNLRKGMGSFFICLNLPFKAHYAGEGAKRSDSNQRRGDLSSSYKSVKRRVFFLPFMRSQKVISWLVKWDGKRATWVLSIFSLLIELRLLEELLTRGMKKVNDWKVGKLGFRDPSPLRIYPLWLRDRRVAAPHTQT